MASAASTHAVPMRAREAASARVADLASYWLIIAATYMTFGFLFYYAAKEKLFDDGGSMPVGLAKGFHGSFIASFPGVNTSWTSLGLLEGLVFVVIAASVLAGEFLPTRRKPILLSGLGLAIFTFALMSFAENMIAEFAIVAELFSYLTGTGVLIILVLLMPPYRATHWLSGLTKR